MPPRSKINMLPQSVKDWFDQALVANNHGRFLMLESELKARGFEISKSAIGRYSKTFEEQLKTLKLSSDMARAVVAASPDDLSDTQEAIHRLASQKLFQLLCDPELEDADVAGLTKAIADLSRANVQLKKFREEAKTKMMKLEAEASEAVAAGRKGLDIETLAAVKAAYGIS